MRVLIGLLVLLTCFVTSGCGGGDGSAAKVEAQAAEEPTVATAQNEGAREVVWRDNERGFTVTYPDTWQRAASPLTPHLSDPLELLALGTYELRPGGDRCSHQPVNAVEDLGTEDALLVIFERAQPYETDGYPPRRGPPELSGGTNRFCVSGTKRSDSWFSFGESGRAFYALIALGENASEETRAQLYATYESIRLDER